MHFYTGISPLQAVHGHTMVRNTGG